MWRVISCLTAGEDRTAVVCWIRLVDKDKSRSSAVCERWRRACPGFARYSLGGFLANAVLAFVLEFLIKLIIQTTAEGLSHSQNQATISALNECGIKKESSYLTWNALRVQASCKDINSLEETSRWMLANEFSNWIENINLTTFINTHARLFVEELHAIRTEATFRGEIHVWFIRTRIKKGEGSVLCSLELRKHLLCTERRIFASTDTYSSSQVGCSAGPQGL